MERLEAVETSTSQDLSQVHRSPHTFEVVEPVKRGPNDKGKGTVLDPKYVYETSDLKDDPVAEAYRNDPDRLFNDREPHRAYSHEQPQHRLMVYLKAQGLTNKEIAARLDYSLTTVTEVLRQPWARLLLVKELKEAGQDAIQGVLRGEALNSVFDIVDIRNDPTTPKNVRLAADVNILDRFLGKPTQKVETNDVSTPSSPELQQLDQQIKELEAQIANKQTNPAAPTNEQTQTPA